MMLLSTAAMAQDDQKQRPQGQRPDRTEMIQKRTDDVVKKYGLNDKQAKELLSLNTKFADKMRGPRGMRPEGKGKRPEGKDVRQGGPRPEGKQMSDSLRMRRPDGQRPGRRAMDENMKEYEQELQKIMTPEQYKAYTADRDDRAKRMREARQNRRQ